jgi:NAD(P)-dependent dehydrogenase (short-subunit alcohol dehydrogenase family)
VLVVATDVGDPEQVDLLFEQTMARFGRVDLLFNNAGSGTPPVPMEDLTFEQWQRCLAVNLTGCFLCAQRVQFMAPWDQPEKVELNDFLVTPPDHSEIYRIARKEFFETYKLDS